MTDVKPADTADRLHSAAIRLLRRLRKADAEAGLTGPQGSAMSVLVFGGETTPSRLAAVEQVSAPSMSRLLKELQAAGLIERRVDPADARGALISATPEGRALLARARELRLGRLARALGSLPPDELAGLDRAARTVLALAEGSILDEV